MLFREFLVWLKDRGILAGVTEVDVWADDDDGCRALTEVQTNGIIGDPVICFLATDAQEQIQMLVVEAFDPRDTTENNIDFRVWVPITIAPQRNQSNVRMICHQPYWGESGTFAYWLRMYELDVEQLAII